MKCAEFTVAWRVASHSEPLGSVVVDVTSDTSAPAAKLTLLLWALNSISANDQRCLNSPCRCVFHALQVRLIAAMLSPLLEVVVNHPSLADPSGAAAVAHHAASLPGSTSVSPIPGSSHSPRPSSSTAGAAAAAAAAASGSSAGGVSAGSQVPRALGPVAVAAAALLQLRLLEAFFFLPAAQLWSGCHEQLLQLCCRQLLGVGGSMVSRGTAQLMKSVLGRYCARLLHCLTGNTAPAEAPGCRPALLHCMFCNQPADEVGNSPQPHGSPSAFRAEAEEPALCFLQCTADAAACVAASSLKHMLISQDALLGPWLPGRDMLEDELRTFVGEELLQAPCSLL